MVEGSAITEEMRNAIGVESAPMVYEIEKGAVRKLAHSTLTMMVSKYS